METSHSSATVLIADIVNEFIEASDPIPTPVEILEEMKEKNPDLEYLMDRFNTTFA